MPADLSESNDASDPLRVLIVDDHAVVRAGLRAVLEDEPGLAVVGEAAIASEAVEKVRALAPDVALMDIRLGEDDDAGGIDACRIIRSELPETKVLIFTSYGERQSVLAAILAGATGFLTKNVAQSRLVEAIRSVAGGESLLDSSATRGVIDHLLDPGGSPAQAPALSEREREILALITQGLTNKEIAARLVISPYTARNHVIRILNKLGLSRRSEAAAYGARLGLGEDEGQR